MGEMIFGIEYYNNYSTYMRGLLRLVNSFSSKKLGIADTAKVIQEKILNITQTVGAPLCRTASMSSEP